MAYINVASVRYKKPRLSNKSFPELYFYMGSGIAEFSRF